MAKVKPAESPVLTSDGWYKPFSEWKLAYEPQKPPTKAAAAQKQPSPEQLAKNRKKTLRRISWVVDQLGQAAFEGIVAALPELGAEFLGSVSDAAREEAKAHAGEEATFLTRVARLCNAMAAMDATMRFEETATQKHRPSCCNPFKSCCVSYPKPNHFERMRREKVAPDLQVALSDLLCAAQHASGAQGASQALARISQLSSRLSSLLAQVSEGSGGLKQLTDTVEKAVRSHAAVSALHALQRGTGAASATKAMVEADTTSTMQLQLSKLLGALGSDQTAEVAARALAESIVGALAGALVNHLREGLVQVACAAIFGDGPAGKSAMHAIHVCETAGVALSVDAAVAAAGQEAADAMAAFEEASKEVSALAVLPPHQLASEYEKNSAAVVAELAVHKKEVLEQLKMFLGQHL